MKATLDKRWWDINHCHILYPVIHRHLLVNQFSCVYDDRLFPAIRFTLIQTNSKVYHCVLKEDKNRDISIENTYVPAGSLLLVQRNGRKDRDKDVTWSLIWLEVIILCNNTHGDASHFSGPKQFLEDLLL